MSDQSLWSVYCRSLAACEELVPMLQQPDDPQTQLDYFNMCAGSLVSSYLGGVQNDAHFPDFVPIANSSLSLGAPCPDFAYFYAAIDWRGTYRITGRRGTSCFVDFQAGKLWGGLGGKGRILGSFDLDSLGPFLDGSVDIMVGPDRPADWDGAWWQVPEEADHFFVRHCLYDWEGEEDARLAIERVDGPAARPRLTAQQLDFRMATVFAAVCKQNAKWLMIVSTSFDRDVVNRGEYLPIAVNTSDGVCDQAYYSGGFEVAENEALLLKVRAPTVARYWSFALTDLAFQHIDFMHRFGSINGRQAHVDDDGFLRFVLSWRDPGCANWLDISGYPRGTFLGRWNGSDVIDIPNFTLIKLADLPAYLPAGSPAVGPAQRDEMLRRRRRALQLRRRW